MRRLLWSLSIAISILSLTLTAAAQESTGQVMVPESSIAKPGDLGVRARTNVSILVPFAKHGAPPFPGYFFETPASIACVYELVSSLEFGCNPNKTTLNPSGGSRTIAVVDAYDDPTASLDLGRFSKQFGLPKAKFSVVYANGGIRPPVDPTGGWELEESLDIEWTHAMAPKAKIILVEARSNTLGDLLQAEDVASKLVASSGGGEISNGWGGDEFPGESFFDSHFTKKGVVYVAASGDAPGVEYPASSPNVVGAGGTSIMRDPTSGAFQGETAWQLTGGGPSVFEERPTYQDVISGIVGDVRGTPDISLDGDPNSGAWVYDSNPIMGEVGWFIVGGTSLSSAALAGIINSAGNFYSSTNAELTVVYDNLGNDDDYRDITTGTCGLYIAYEAVMGWDFCTGVGSAIGLNGK
ncbi:MAG TPA: S53 family peptidase [Candidatus Binataceae bacterium]|nr:S53 family peptidase [Candidatus Binataceae bacterium]